MIAPSGDSFPADITGISDRTVNVTACGGSWTAKSNASWIHVTGGTSGTLHTITETYYSGSGDGTVTYNVTENNPGSSARSGTITIAGKTLTILQMGAGTLCTKLIIPFADSYPADVTGISDRTVNVTACGDSWTAKSNASWIHVTGGTNGTFDPATETYSSSVDGTATYNLTENNPGSSSRSGTITIAGWTLTITQDGTGSSTTGSVTPSSPDGSADIAAATVIVTDTVDGAPEDLHPAGVLSFTATGITKTAAQVCFSFSPPQPTDSVFYKILNGIWYEEIHPVNEMILSGLTNVSFDGTGTNLCFTIEDNSLADGCKVTGIIQDPITFGTPAPPAATTTSTPGGSGGSGGGGGAHDCTFALDPTLQDFSSSGGAGRIQVTANPSPCIWASYSKTPWIKITSGTSDTYGSGEIVYTVTENTSSEQRTGSIFACLQEISIIQKGTSAQSSTTTSATQTTTTSIPYPRPTTTTTTTGEASTTTTTIKKCPLRRSADRQEYIDTLLAVRDGKLETCSFGMLITTIYYKHADEVSRLLDQYPQLDNQVKLLTAKYMPVARELLAKDRVKVSQTAIDEIRGFLSSLKAVGSPALTHDISLIIQGMHNAKKLGEMGVTVE